MTGRRSRSRSRRERESACGDEALASTFQAIADAVAQMQEALLMMQLKMERTDLAVTGVARTLHEQGPLVHSIEQRMHVLERSLSCSFGSAPSSDQPTRPGPESGSSRCPLASVGGDACCEVTARRRSARPGLGLGPSRGPGPGPDPDPDSGPGPDPGPSPGLCPGSGPCPSPVLGAARSSASAFCANSSLCAAQHAPAPSDAPFFHSPYTQMGPSYPPGPTASGALGGEGLQSCPTYCLQAPGMLSGGAFPYNLSAFGGAMYGPAGAAQPPLAALQRGFPGEDAAPCANPSACCKYLSQEVSPLALPFPQPAAAKAATVAAPPPAKRTQAGGGAVRRVAGGAATSAGLRRRRRRRRGAAAPPAAPCARCPALVPRSTTSSDVSAPAPAPAPAPGLAHRRAPGPAPAPTPAPAPAPAPARPRRSRSASGSSRSASAPRPRRPQVPRCLSECLTSCPSQRIDNVSKLASPFGVAPPPGSLAATCAGAPQTPATRRLAALGKNLLNAAQEGRVEAVRNLLEEGANVNFVFGSDWTPLHRAAAKGHWHVVTLLLKHGAHVHARVCGFTALHMAAYDDLSGRCVATLLAAGADPNGKNNFGRTPLHYAAQCGNEAAVRALLAAGSCKAAKDKEGRTPVELAKTHCVRRLLAGYRSRQRAARSVGVAEFCQQHIT